ncbi:hypothetical protein FOZ62_018091, partial [Perkinsus olseni]
MTHMSRTATAASRLQEPLSYPGVRTELRDYKRRSSPPGSMFDTNTHHHHHGGGGGGGDIFTYDENSMGVNRRASSPPNYDIPRPNPEEVFMATSPSSSSSPPRQGFNNHLSSIQNV